MDPVRFAWKWTGLVLMIICVIWALWRGEKPERTGAVILATSWGLTDLFHKHGVYGPEVSVILIDCITLLAFIWLSLWSRRLWTVFLSAFQLDAVASHFAVLLAPQIGSFSYITATGLWGGYGLVFALAAGMWGIERRRQLRVAAA